MFVEPNDVAVIVVLDGLFILKERVGSGKRVLGRAVQLSQGVRLRVCMFSWTMVLASDRW